MPTTKQMPTPSPLPGFTPLIRVDAKRGRGLTYIVGTDQSGMVKAKIYGIDKRATGHGPTDWPAVAAAALRLAARCLEQSFWVHLPNGVVGEENGRNVSLVYWEPTEAEYNCASQVLAMEKFADAIAAEVAA